MELQYLFGIHANFMPPNVHTREQVGDIAYELASGKGIFVDTAWGVTIKNINTRKDDPRYPSTLFTVEKKAYEYIATIKLNQLLQDSYL